MRHLVISTKISQQIGNCQLTRNGLVRLLANLHNLPQRHGRFQGFRHPDDDRLFLFFESIIDDRHVHYFTFFIDDSTSDQHLMVHGFEHKSRPRGQ